VKRYFKTDSNLQNDIQQIIKDALISTHTDIENRDLPLSKKVHTVRKMCKKSRAILQLIKPLLKDQNSYQKENDFYKNMAKLLASSREAKVMTDMFNMIIKNYKLDQNKFIDIKKSLQKIETNEHIENTKTLENLKSCRFAIETAIENIDRLELTTNSIYGLRTGYKDTYKKAQKYMKKAYKKLDIDTYHEFRKYAKYHMFQVDILSKRSAFDKKRVKKLKNLTDILGIEHDLTLFEEYLNKNHLSYPNAKTVIPYINKDQKKLRKKAKKLEDLLFKLSPEKIELYAII
jgi:hypothetical protein